MPPSNINGGTVSLTINVDQDDNYTFFAEYDKLGPLQRKIWLSAVWWVKRFPCAHPSQSKIAKHIGCRREHVNRAFSKFKKYGWLYLTSRGHKRTKILGIPTHLVLMDVNKREYFKRIEITSKRTHSSSRFPGITSRAGEKRKGLEIPAYLRKWRFSDDGKLILSLFTEYTFQESVHKYKITVASGWQPEQEERYFIGIARKIGKSRGERPDWRSYYQMRKSA